VLPQVAGEAGQRREVTRVDAAMLEELLNDAGEISISHSRLNQQLSSIQFNLEELGTTVSRLQQQLRLLEIETEAQILFKHQSEADSAEGFDPLELDRYSTIQQLSRALVETANDVNSIKELLRNLAADAETILLHQKRTASAMQDSLMRTRMVPFDQHVPRLSRLVRQQATESGKQVELNVEGSSGELDRQVMEKMLPPFEHMLRNAVIHGIELPEERVEQGKPESGTITIRFRREGSEVVIDVSDDGAGLDLDAIRRKALERGVLQPDRDISHEELAQLIFHSGLSTASRLTQSAGRGIGMDVVQSEVAKLGGRVTIRTSPGQGSTFTVRLPYTLAVSQAFVVRVGKESFALPLATVEGITRISHEQYTLAMRQDEPAIEQRGRGYRLRHLGPYLGLGPAKFAPDTEQIPLILVRAGENSTALIVDETADHREIVVKPIGALLAGIRGIAGATILGDGSIVVILDAGALVRDMRPQEDDEIKAVGEVIEKVKPLALVVDDSITMRRVTQRLLERNGLRVLTAKDGIEALEILRDKTPDIIVLDIEMPRMDGYELATNVRNTPATAELPIIMVTSRVGEKHRARAIEIGVNDYLGKPYQEHEMLDAVRNLLGGISGSDEESESFHRTTVDS
jgi:chemosensory pili system protein ChpA (sensor histidine kinase/response regulator)